MRVNNKFDGHENLAKDHWNIAFLGIVTLDYVALVGYSFTKCYCHAAVYMIISSIVGAVITFFCGFIGLVRDIGRVIYISGN